MIQRNEFQAYKKKNKTTTKSFHYHAKLLVLALLLLLPLVTDAIDSTKKLRGKENDLVNLSYESIDSVIRVPDESGNNALSTGGEEESSQFSHITHESSISMLDEAQMKESESFDIKNINVLKNDFHEQAKMASDQSLSMTSIPGKPLGESCVNDEECESGLCSASSAWSVSCFPAVQCCSEAGGPTNSTQGPTPPNLPLEETYWPTTSTPGPTPQTSTPVASNCFSSETTVTHSERGLVPISEIEVGDYIQSHNNGLFSRVYVHEKNHHKEASFVQIYSSKGVVLELTDGHMLFLKNRSNPVPARDIRVGDILDTKNEDSGTRVEKIGIVTREGYYNPLTEDGTIIVNDNVYASSHVAAKESASCLYSEREIVSWETLAQIGTAPLRLTCKAVWFGFCSHKRFQNGDGLHTMQPNFQLCFSLSSFQCFSAWVSSSQFWSSSMIKVKHSTRLSHPLLSKIEVWASSSHAL